MVLLAYLYIELIDVIEKVSDCIFTLSSMQQHKFNVSCRQKGRHLLMIYLFIDWFVVDAMW